MPRTQLANLTQPQRNWLALMELRVRFIGDIRRQDLVSRFGIQSSAASRDLALYKELAPGNIDYDSKAKSYVLGSSFQPVFNFPPERLLSWLTQGFGDGEPMRLKAWVVSESPSRLTHPYQPRPEISEMGYGMDGGVLKVKIRAAMAGYMLRKWRADCSPDHRLKEEQYRLNLSDPLVLNDAQKRKFGAALNGDIYDDLPKARMALVLRLESLVRAPRSAASRCRIAGARPATNTARRFGLDQVVPG